MIGVIGVEGRVEGVSRRNRGQLNVVNDDHSTHRFELNSACAAVSAVKSRLALRLSSEGSMTVVNTQGYARMLEGGWDALREG